MDTVLTSMDVPMTATEIAAENVRERIRRLSAKFFSEHPERITVTHDASEFPELYGKSSAYKTLVLMQIDGYRGVPSSDPAESAVPAPYVLSVYIVSECVELLLLTEEVAAHPVAAYSKEGVRLAQELVAEEDVAINGVFQLQLPDGIIERIRQLGEARRRQFLPALARRLRSEGLQLEFGSYNDTLEIRRLR